MTKLAALVKYRFHDFIVDEIFADAPVQLNEAPPVYPQFQKTLNALTPDPNAPAPDFGPVVNALPFTDEQKAQIERFLLAKEPNTKLTLTSPAGVDKLARTQFHQAVRALCFPALESGAPEGFLTLHFHAKVQMPAMDERSRFWNFVLLKRDIDTMSAAQVLIKSSCRYQKLQQQHITYAGVKDQRGVTQQILQIPGYFYPEGIAGNLPDNIRVGNFQRTDSLVKLGSHDGNRFTITLRALGGEKGGKPSESQLLELQSNLKDVAERGVLNLFGVQRFGTSIVSTDKMGLVLVQGRFRLFLRFLIINDFHIKHQMAPEDQERARRFMEDVCDSRDREKATDADFEKEVEEMIARLAETVKATNKPNQLARLLGDMSKPLMELTNDEIYKALSNVMSRSQLTFYFHAFQSRIFNDLAQELAKRSGLEENDLVLDQFNNVRLVTAETLGHEKFEHLSLPLIGFQTVLPGNHWAEKLKNIQEKYGFDTISPSYRNIFAPGGMRNVFISVKNLRQAAFVHENLQEQFGPTQFDRLAGTQIQELDFKAIAELDLVKDAQRAAEEGKYLSLVLQFELPTSAYATEVINKILGYDVSYEEQIALGTELKEE